jgi:hypothetical protein
VNDRIPDRPVFEQSFSGHFLNTVFKWSGIRMSSSTIQIRFLNGPKMDRFIKKRVIKTILLLIKWSRLVRTVQKPDYLSSFHNDHPNTGRSQTRQIRPVFGWYSKTEPFDNRAQIEHLNTGFVRYSDGDCTGLVQYLNGQKVSSCRRVTEQPFQNLTNRPDFE